LSNYAFYILKKLEKGGNWYISYSFVLIQIVMKTTQIKWFF